LPPIGFNMDIERNSKYLILPSENVYVSKIILELRKQLPDVCYIDEKEFINNQYVFLKNCKIYTTSDSLYPIIKNCLPHHVREVFEIFRNKFLFRKLLAKFFPDFIFNQLTLSQIENYPFDFEKSARYVLKPITGFMAGGVRVVDKTTNLKRVAQELAEEIEKYKGRYPGIFSDQVIAEYFIEGRDEYAIDVYYDDQGHPIIENIYCHPAAKRPEYQQSLYYMAQTLFDQYFELAINFFKKINKKLQIKNFPLHAEFKLDNKGQFIPIEFNPGRFGGMDLANLGFFVFGRHSIQDYFEGKKLNWEKAWASMPDETFCFVFAYNGADVDLNKYRPDHNIFKSYLPKTAKLLSYVELDYKKCPGFAMACLELENQNDIRDILNIEFNDCFVNIEGE